MRTFKNVSMILGAIQIILFVFLILVIVIYSVGEWFQDRKKIKQRYLTIVQSDVTTPNYN